MTNDRGDSMSRENGSGVEGHAAQRGKGEGADGPSARQVIHSSPVCAGKSAAGGASQAVKPEIEDTNGKPKHTAGINPGLPFSLPVEGNDLALAKARDEILTMLSDACDTGFDDIVEFLVKIAGIRDVCDELEKRASKVADEQAERYEEPYDSGWVSEWNRGR